MPKYLKLTNCLDCPHHKQIQDPSSDDSWDFHDTSIVCTKKKRSASKDRWNPEGYRHVTGPDRFNARKDCNIPTWCPL